MTKEQGIEILKCFKDNEIQRDKLEIDNRCGGWKIGRIYKSLELNMAIEIVLSMLKEKDKIIDEMAKTINEAYYASGDFEEWFENKICKIQRYEDYTYLEKNIKQYFERKVEG